MKQKVKFVIAEVDSMTESLYWHGREPFAYFTAYELPWGPWEGQQATAMVKEGPKALTIYHRGG